MIEADLKKVKSHFTELLNERVDFEEEKERFNIQKEAMEENVGDEQKGILKRKNTRFFLFIFHRISFTKKNVQGI